MSKKKKDLCPENEVRLEDLGLQDFIDLFDFDSAELLKKTLDFIGESDRLRVKYQRPKRHKVESRLAGASGVVFLDDCT